MSVPQPAALAGSALRFRFGSTVIAHAHVCREKAADGARSVDALLDVQVRRRLIKHVAVSDEAPLSSSRKEGAGVSPSAAVGDAHAKRAKRSSLHVCLLDAGHGDGKALKLAARQFDDVARLHIAQL